MRAVQMYDQRAQRQLLLAAFGGMDLTDMQWAVLWVLRTGAPWHDLPPLSAVSDLPSSLSPCGNDPDALRSCSSDSPKTCETATRSISPEAFVDATFAGAKKGGAAVGPTRRGYDSDALDERLMTQFGIEMIAAHRRGRRSTQDGRALRRAPTLEDRTALRVAPQLASSRHALGTSCRQLPGPAASRLRQNPPQAFMS